MNMFAGMSGVSPCIPPGGADEDSGALLLLAMFTILEYFNVRISMKLHVHWSTKLVVGQCC